MLMNTGLTYVNTPHRIVAKGYSSSMLLVVGERYRENMGVGRLPYCTYGPIRETLFFPKTKISTIFQRKNNNNKILTATTSLN